MADNGEMSWAEFVEAHKPKHPAVYDACMKMAESAAQGTPAKSGRKSGRKSGKGDGAKATPWLHLADAVERGRCSPMDAYDAIERGYLPEYLTVRESRYQHLL